MTLSSSTAPDRAGTHPYGSGAVVDLTAVPPLDVDALAVGNEHHAFPDRGLRVSVNGLSSLPRSSGGNPFVLTLNANRGRGSVPTSFTHGA